MVVGGGSRFCGYGGMVHWGDDGSLVCRPLKRVGVVVGRNGKLVLPPAPVAVAGWLYAPELSVMGPLPRHLLAFTALVVHIHVVLARIILGGVEGRVRVEFDVESAPVEEHHVGMCLQLVDLLRL